MASDVCKSLAGVATRPWALYNVGCLVLVAILVFHVAKRRRRRRGTSRESSWKATTAVLLQKKKTQKPHEYDDPVLNTLPATTVSTSGAAGPHDEPLWDVEHRGFLPRRAPLRAPRDPHFAVLEDLAAELPSACRARRVRAIVLARAPQLLKAADFVFRLSEDDAEAAHGLYSYLAAAYVTECSRSSQEEEEKDPLSACPVHARRKQQHGQKKQDVNRRGASSQNFNERHVRLPSCLARGFRRCADALGRRPWLDYVGCVLYNWELVDPRGPISTENVRMLRRFTGLVDEEWFFKTHLVIEAAAADCVRAIKAGADVLTRQSRDHERGETLRVIATLHDALRTIDACFGHVARECLPLMFERGAGDHGALCDAAVFYSRLRPFMFGARDVIFEGEFDDQPLSFPGPSGAMSSLLPALDAFLGVDNSNATLRTLLDDFKVSMPTRHRQFLEQLATTSRAEVSSPRRRRRSRKSETTYVLMTCREFVLRARRDAAECTSHDLVSDAEALAIQFERCVDNLLDFRWRHLNMVRKYVVEPSGGDVATGTGGTPALEYLHQHIADTEAAKLPPQVWPTPSQEAIHHETTTRRKTQTQQTGEQQPKKIPNQRHPEVAGAEVDELDSVWAVDGEVGFLPRKAPSVTPPIVGLEPLDSLARRIPFLCASVGGRFRDVVNAVDFDALSQPIANLTDVADVERCRVTLAFVVAAYSRCDAAAGTPLPHTGTTTSTTRENTNVDDATTLLVGDAPLPRGLKALWGAVSNRLKRSRRLCLTDLVTFNLAAGTTRSPLCCFLASPEEDALYRRLNDVERASPALVAAIEAGREAMGLVKGQTDRYASSSARRDDDDDDDDRRSSHHRAAAALVDALAAVRSALIRAAASSGSDVEDGTDDVQRGQKQATAIRNERAAMRRLRHFLAPPGASTDADVAAFLYVGDSLVLPAAWAFLGVPTKTGGFEEPIGGRAAGHLQRARDAALRHKGRCPAPHRKWFETRVKNVRPVILDLCRSTTPPQSEDASSSSSGTTTGTTTRGALVLPVHAVARLEAAYNACVDELLRFCARRAQLVTRYLGDVNDRGGGGARPSQDPLAGIHRDLDLDRRLVQAARLNLLLDRRLKQRRSSRALLVPHKPTPPQRRTAKLQPATPPEDHISKQQPPEETTTAAQVEDEVGLAI